MSKKIEFEIDYLDVLANEFDGYRIIGRMERMMFNEKTANAQEIEDEAMRISKIIYKERLNTCKDNDLLDIYKDELEKLVTKI